MFDSFVATLRCPACGAAVTEAEIQTYIRDGSADGSALRVGDELDAVDLETDSILDADYALVTPPGPGPIRLLDVFLCLSCRTEQWAMIEIAGRTIRRIEAVTLDRETLASANFISDVNAGLAAAALRDQELDADATSVEVLARRLPAG